MLTSAGGILALLQDNPHVKVYIALQILSNIHTSTLVEYFIYLNFKDSFENKKNSHN